MGNEVLESNMVLTHGIEHGIDGIDASWKFPREDKNNSWVISYSQTFGTLTKCTIVLLFAPNLGSNELPSNNYNLEQ